ncbi:MAG TPA: hypothetical protein VK053_00650 [Jiangellaceae bacterium]|nr:hypothetical protein [Jiangellaceae bacterium]
MRAADLDYRSATLEAVVVSAQEDLGGLWRSLLNDPVERAAMGLREVVPAVAEAYGQAAAGNAVVWYEDVRPAGARVYRARPFVPASLAEVEGLTTWAATPLFSNDQAAAWERVTGLLQKAIADHDRATVEGNVDRDPIGRGWRRRASADACAFCAYMAVAVGNLRGPLDEAEASEAYHDHCNCVPVPVLDGDTLPEQPNGDAWLDTFQAAYDAVDREQRAAYRRWTGRRHDFLRAHQDLTLTTKNILARARRLEPDLFRDGVRLAA